MLGISSSGIELRDRASVPLGQAHPALGNVGLGLGLWQGTARRSSVGRAYILAPPLHMRILKPDIEPESGRTRRHLHAKVVLQHVISELGEEEAIDVQGLGWGCTIRLFD